MIKIMSICYVYGQDMIQDPGFQAGILQLLSPACSIDENQSLGIQSMAIS